VRGIAGATGLSVATVSRVINGAINVAPRTRRQVLDAIAAAGFEPNAAARALSTRRSRTLGALIPTLAHSIFATFLNGIERESARHGYALVVATTGNDIAVEAARARDLLQLGAEGLIVSGARRDAGFEALIAQRRLPVVATSIYNPRYVLPTIGYDNRALGRLALRHLRDLGHRRIAVLHGPLAENDRTRLRLAGVRAALGTRPTPTALLCLSDVLALGALFEARRATIEVPAQLSIMGFDDLDWAAVCEPPLTTLRLPTARMGELAARALIDFLDRGAPIRACLLAADTVVRESTAAPPTRRRR
jgi:LacI family transcriptional regulator